MASPRKTFKPSTPAPVAAPAPATVAAPAARSVEAKGSGTAKARPAVPATFSHDTIAKRAFEIYASRGYAAGNPDEDWREAERQLRAGL